MDFATMRLTAIQGYFQKEFKIINHISLEVRKSLSKEDPTLLY